MIPGIQRRPKVTHLDFFLGIALPTISHPLLSSLSVVLASISDSEKLFQQSLFEIFSTETDFVSDLEKVIIVSFFLSFFFFFKLTGNTTGH